LAHRRANATFRLHDFPLLNQEPPLSLTRRHLLVASAFSTLAGGGFAATVLPPLIGTAQAEDAGAAPSPADLADAGPNGDFMIGSDKAPVTIIEYASMTCPHCAHFEETTLPELKKRYIDTGKVRYVMREFPLDALAAAGFMLARCAGPDKYESVVETLFAKQPDWVTQKPIPPLMAIAKQFGFTEDSFNACLANQKVLDDIQAVRDHAVNKLGVNSTPTFFVNGKRLVGDVSIDQLAKEIDPYLKEG
jgi:protein-disulfide isomerase